MSPAPSHRRERALHALVDGGSHEVGIALAAQEGGQVKAETIELGGAIGVDGGRGDGALVVSMMARWVTLAQPVVAGEEAPNGFYFSFLWFQPFIPRESTFRSQICNIFWINIAHD